MRFVLALTLACPLVAFAQTVRDPNLKVDTWVTGLSDPTGMTFLSNATGDALVLEKNTGRVIHTRGRKIVGTALDLPVATDSERGLLGIVKSPDFDQSGFVYLYHTAADVDGGTPITNKISRYRWNGSTLDFNKKIIDLPVTPGPNHDGGKMAFDNKGFLYVGIGDLNRHGRTQNFTADKRNLDRSGAVLRLTSAGKSVPTNPFYDEARIGAFDEPLNDIFAYGIRNTFGLAIDPKTNDLWQTENGPSDNDEINRLRPGANSGWRKFMGPIERSDVDEADLESFTDRAYYADPRFTWSNPIGVTDAFFMDTTRIGDEYKDDLFVGDTKTGVIWDFELTASRKTLSLDGKLLDKVADNENDLLAEQDTLVFAEGFGTTTEILTGPGGLYVLSYSNKTLYRITTDDAVTSSGFLNAIPEPTTLTATILAIAMLRRRRGTPSKNERVS